MRASLDWITGLFLGTFVGVFLGTVSGFSETMVWRGGTRGGWLWWGSWIHKRRLSCNGEVIIIIIIKYTSAEAKD